MCNPFCKSFPLIYMKVMEGPVQPSIEDPALVVTFGPDPLLHGDSFLA